MKRIPPLAHARQRKDLKNRYNGGSGFPAAIYAAGVKTIRGWEAAPTIHNLLNLITVRFFHIIADLIYSF